MPSLKENIIKDQKNVQGAKDRNYRNSESRRGQCQKRKYQENPNQGKVRIWKKEIFGKSWTKKRIWKKKKKNMRTISTEKENTEK